MGFRPKIDKFLAKFPRILEINKKHLNTAYVKILGHLGHFWQNMAIFGNFLAHFGLYNCFFSLTSSEIGNTHYK